MHRILTEVFNFQPREAPAKIVALGFRTGRSRPHGPSCLSGHSRSTYSFPDPAQDLTVRRTQGRPPSHQELPEVARIEPRQRPRTGDSPVVSGPGSPQTKFPETGSRERSTLIRSR